MGLMRFIMLWTLCYVILINLSAGDKDINLQTGLLFKDDPRQIQPKRHNHHRLQLLFPLLLNISSRLATIVPAVYTGLVGIFLFVLFAKKALIVSLLALFLSVSDKVKKNNEDIVIHKVSSYPEYNGEEHYYYHTHPVKDHYYKYKKKHLRRNFENLSGNFIKPFKPIPNQKNKKNFDYYFISGSK